MTADYFDQAAQDDLWDFLQPPADEAKRLRDAGTEVALNAADSRARGAAERALRDLAASGGVFSSDDLHERVGGPLGCSSAVMGSLFLSAARRGEIEHIGYIKSKRPSSHGREVKTWRGTGNGPRNRNHGSDSAPAHREHVPDLKPAAGVWTVADVAKPCRRCRHPAFMRCDGVPLHKAVCGGAS